MRKMIFTGFAALAIFVLFSSAIIAGEGRGQGTGNLFKNFYQWLRDDDGDGIPNCLDPDYVKPEDGTGYGKLGRANCGDCDGDKDQIRLRTRDREQLKDGSCTQTNDGYIYRLRYKEAKSQR